MKYTDFEVGKKAPDKEWKRQGKAEWSDIVHLHMDHRSALELISQIAQQLAHTNSPTIIVSLPGELKCLDSESPTSS